MKQCTKCLILQVVDNFYKCSKNKSGIQATCKSCDSLKGQQWYSKNKEHRDEVNSLHYNNNKSTYAAKCRKRQASKLNRTPKWLTNADLVEIEWAYKVAQELTMETGIIHVVDHIIPLQGKNISGLHCPQNLQIITKLENSKKGNKFQPGIIPRQ